jgi:hypothetical protein
MTKGQSTTDLITPDNVPFYDFGILNIGARLLKKAATKGGVTSSAIEGATEAAAKRASQSSAKNTIRKVCSRGTNCGGTCISQLKRCILKMSPNVSSQVSELATWVKARKQLISKNPKVSEKGAKTLVTPAELRTPVKGLTGVDKQRALASRTAGLKTEDVAPRTRMARNSLEKIRREYPDPKEFQERVKYVTDMAYKGGRGKRPGSLKDISPEELEGLRKNKELLQKISDLQEDISSSTGAAKDKAIQKYFDFMVKAKNDKYLYDASEGQIDLFLALLPDKTYRRLRVAGGDKRLKQLTWGTSKPSPSAVATSRDEIVETLAPGQPSVNVQAQRANAYSTGREYLNTGGKDFYSGVKRNINDFDLEHVIARPENEVIWDSIPNRVLTSVALNSKKTASPVSVLLESNGPNAIWGGGKGVTASKGSLVDDIQSGSIKLSEALDSIKNLSSEAKKDLYPAVISKILGPTAGKPSPKTISVGLNKNDKARSWGLLGSKRDAPGWSNVEVNGEKITPPVLGERIATQLAKWEEAGDVGKIQNFKNAKDNLWQELTAINKKSIPGTDELVSRSRVAEESRGIPTPALKFVNEQIAEIMENRVPELLKLLEG